MKIDEIRLWYAYNDWANQRILAAAGKVSEDQYTTPASNWSLRGTLVHILDAMWWWRSACQGTVTREELTEANLPTLDALKRRWQTEEQEMQAYLGRLSDEDLNDIVRYPLETGTVRERVLWHCLLHLVNHGTQHRSEAAVFLTNYGQSPGGLDFTLFLNEHYNLPD
jgi:uncharacterized damage-inducible protein DinB